MSGIIINIPQQARINPTNNVVPVKSGDTFIDSNITNVFNNDITTKVGGNAVGLTLDFVNSNYSLGNISGLNFYVNDYNARLEMSGASTFDYPVIPYKIIELFVNGETCFLQLYKTI